MASGVMSDQQFDVFMKWFESWLEKTLDEALSNAFFKHFGIVLFISSSFFTASPASPIAVVSLIFSPSAPSASLAAAAVKFSSFSSRSPIFNATVNIKRRCMAKSSSAALVIVRPPSSVWPLAVFLLFVTWQLAFFFFFLAGVLARRFSPQGIG